MKFAFKFIFILFVTLQSCYSFVIDFMILPKIEPEYAISLVKSSTAILPQFDSIGHHVLHMNQILINRIIDSNIDPNLKKTLILKVIDFTREGDEMGGKILENYYNFIDYLL